MGGSSSRRRCRSCLGRRRGRGGRLRGGGSAGLNAAQHGTGKHFRPRIGGNGGNHTRHRRIHFHRYLIGLEFHQRLISHHGVTGFFQPTRNGGGRNAFAQSGHNNIGHCSIRSKTNTRQPARAARTNASC